MTKRELHRKLSLIIFLPLTVIVFTGLALQLRNQFEWIQPSTISGQKMPQEVISFSRLIAQHNLEPKTVEQMIYRPSKNNVAIRLVTGEEIQIDAYSGKILKRAQRRTNFLIDLHQGSILGPVGQYGIYLLSALGLILLLITGAMLLFPKKVKI